MEKFQLNKRRQLGDIISDAFKLLFYKPKVLFGLFFIYVIPVALIVSYFMYKSMANMTADTMGAMGSFTDIGVLFFRSLSFIIPAILLYGIHYTYMLEVRDQDPDAINLDSAKQRLWPTTLRAFTGYMAIMLVFIAIYVLMILLVLAFTSIGSSFLSAIIAIGIGLFMMYVAIPIMFVPFIYVEQEKPLVECVKYSFALVRNNWWNTFGVVLVCGLISYFVVLILVLPVSLIMGFAGLSGLEGMLNGGENMGVLMGVYIVFSLFSGLIINLFMNSAIVLKYYDLMELKEATKLSDQIDDFGKEEEGFFENEGDY